MQPRRAFKTPAAPTSGREPVWYYHGTQTAVDRLPDPRLDPNLALGGDTGDPTNPDGSIKPHVFLTPNLLDAQMYSLGIRRGNLVIKNLNAGTSQLVFLETPEFDQPGYVYAFDKRQHAPFEETYAHGQRTGKFAAFEYLDVSQGPIEVVRGIRGLLQTTSVQAYVLDSPKEARSLVAAWRSHVEVGSEPIKEFFDKSVRQGRLNHLNRAYGLT